MCLDIFHLMVDLEELFVAKILRKLDTNDAAIFEVSSLLDTFSYSMQNFKTPLFDSLHV